MRVAPGDAVILCDDVTGEWAARVIEAGKRERRARGGRAVARARGGARFLAVPGAAQEGPLRPRAGKGDRAGRRGDPAGGDPALRGRQAQPRACAQRHSRRPNNARAPRCPYSLRRHRSRTCSAPGRAGRALFFADEAGGEAAARAFAAFTGPAAILTGPEGGFDDAERAAIRAHPQAAADLARPAHPARRDRRHRRARAVDGHGGRLARLIRWRGKNRFSRATRMSTREASSADDPIIESRDQLIAPMAKGEKPQERLAHRHRARKARLQAARSPRPLLRRARRHPRPADGADPVRLGADRGRRQGDRAQGRRRQRQPRTRRPARTVGRAGRNAAPDLRRDRAPPDAGQGNRREMRGRLPRPRHVARQDPRRTADHAQGPLRDHAAAHAARRHPRAST